MTKEIEYEQFGPSDDGGAPATVDFRRVSDIPMELSVEIGRTHMTVGDTLALHVGTIVLLDRLAGEPVDLMANGTPIARGEVVVVDDRFGLRVKEIVESDAGSGASAARVPAQAGPSRAGSAPADASPAAPAPVAPAAGTPADAAADGQLAA
jgi:flagellar motor switch protein FliN/FliY